MEERGRRVLTARTAGRNPAARRPSPARHRPGARSARRDRCLSLVSQTTRSAIMDRLRCATRIAMAVVVVLELAGPVTAQVPVPFSGRLVGVDIGTPQVPPLVSVQVKATGVATQLGQFGFLALITVNASTGLGSGTVLFTAASGETVFGIISGKATFTPPNLLHIAEVGTIT